MVQVVLPSPLLEESPPEDPALPPDEPAEPEFVVIGGVCAVDTLVVGGDETTWGAAGAAAGTLAPPVLLGLPEMHSISPGRTESNAADS